jgi:hypothetical protein
VRIVRRVLLVVGCLALLTGLVWVGQGSGVFPYPASSFMVNQLPWVTRGILLAIGGLLLVGLSRRL